MATVDSARTPAPHLWKRPSAEALSLADPEVDIPAAAPASDEPEEDLEFDDVPPPCADAAASSASPAGAALIDDAPPPLAPPAPETTPATPAATPTGAAHAAPATEGSDPAPTILAIVATLVALGLLMVYSTSAIEAERMADPTFFVRRQALYAILAGIALVFFWHTDYRSLVRHRHAILAVVILLLVLVFVPGLTRPVKGARRWFKLGGLSLQPSELAKLAVVFFLAGAAATRDRLRTLKDMLPVAAWPAAAIVLVFLEPDLGTAALIAAVSGLVLIVGGMPLRHALVLGVPLVGAVGLYAAARFDHVRARVETFLHPEADPLGAGYQVRQSLIALGSGGPSGAGLGESCQKLFFLPDDHTDFILAILGEEMGFVGTLLVAALFSALLWQGLRVAKRAPDPEGFLVAFGITVAIGIQAAMNVAVVTASMPTKGISLPFVSFGGSNLVVALAGVGVLLNVSRQSK